MLPMWKKIWLGWLFSWLSVTTSVKQASYSVCVCVCVCVCICVYIYIYICIDKVFSHVLTISMSANLPQTNRQSVNSPYAANKLSCVSMFPLPLSAAVWTGRHDTIAFEWNGVKWAGLHKVNGRLRVGGRWWHKPPLRHCDLEPELFVKFKLSIVLMSVFTKCLLNVLSSLN